MSRKDHFEDVFHRLMADVDRRYATLRANDQDQQAVNDGDEIATVVDKTITGVFETFFDHEDERYQVVSEEGLKDGNTAVEDPDYTVIVDEIDATANMANRTGHFGPMIAIADGPDPRFEDVVAAAYLDLSHDELYTAYRGEGAYKSVDGLNGRPAPITTSGRAALGQDEDGRWVEMLLDQYMLSDVPEIAQLWRHAKPGDYKSAGQHYAMVADGRFDVFVTGNRCAYSTEKTMTPEELAAGYLLVTEAGGTVMDWDGNEIGDQHINMAQADTFDIVAGASEEIATETVEHINEYVER